MVFSLAFIKVIKERSRVNTVFSIWRLRCTNISYNSLSVRCFIGMSYLVNCSMSFCSTVPLWKSALVVSIKTVRFCLCVCRFHLMPSIYFWFAIFHPPFVPSPNQRGVCPFLSMAKCSKNIRFH